VRRIRCENRSWCLSGIAELLYPEIRPEHMSRKLDSQAGFRLRSFRLGVEAVVTRVVMR
jgi:hypothetical protein